VSKKKPPSHKNPTSLEKEDTLFEKTMLEQDGHLEHEDELFETLMNSPQNSPAQSHEPSNTHDADDALFMDAMNTPESFSADDVEASHPEPQHLPSGLTTAGLLKRCRQGLVAPDLTVDLHGMKQAEARVVLRRHLTRAHQKGQRVALIITGRGLHSKDRAILREEVPGWLRVENADCVEGFEKAPRRMGGEGALLVVIRRGASSVQS